MARALFSASVDQTRYRWEIHPEADLLYSLDPTTGLRRFLAAGQQYDEVLAGLFVGAAPRDYPETRRFVQAVLDLRYLAGADREKAAEGARRAGLDYANQGFEDGILPADELLEEALGWLSARHGQGVPCLVHCVAGVSRSPFVVCAYMLPAFQWDLERAARHLSRRHRDAYPAATFLEHLEGLAAQGPGVG